MAYIVRRNPVLHDIDRVWDSLVGDRGTFPAVDIIEEVGAYRIEADLPGLSESEVEAKIEDRVLVLQSGAPSEPDGKEGRYLIRERSVREFRRSFVVPRDADVTEVEASFTQGVLTVLIPKMPEVKPRSIEIKRA